MTNKKYWTLLLLSVIISIVGTVVIMRSIHTTENKVYTEEEYKELIHNIDSLSLYIDSINNRKDSLSHAVGEAKDKVIIIEKKYEKGYIDITNQSIADDVEFFTNYISKNDARLYDSNYSSAIKEN